jgi:polysaccharide pyruvyl transferase CsaB
VQTPPKLPLKILICGYYGEHNLGDDALLQCLLQGLPSGWQPLVTAADQQEVQNRFQVASCDRRSLLATLRALAHCSALVLGGGSLLQDSTSFKSLIYYAALILAAKAQAKPVLLWGQGLGPLRRRRSRILVRMLLSLVTAASWRDPESAGLAAQLGRGGTSGDLLGTDPVWRFPAQPWRGQGGPIVLAWRPTPLLNANGWLLLLRALQQLAEDQQREVIWLPFHRHQDRGLLNELASQGLLPAGLADRSRQGQPERPEDAMAICTAAGLLVAMRLHALILGALAGAPCAALSYDPKVAAAAKGLGCGCHDLRQLPSQEILVQQWQAQLDRPLHQGDVRRQVDAAAVHQLVLERLLPGSPA